MDFVTGYKIFNFLVLELVSLNKYGSDSFNIFVRFKLNKDF